MTEPKEQYFCPKCGIPMEIFGCTSDPQDGECWSCPRCNYATDNEDRLIHIEDDIHRAIQYIYENHVKEVA